MKLGTADVEIDLHGHHPDDVRGSPLEEVIRQTWETGANSVRLIHGHGHNREKLFNAFVNSDTGYLGQTVRSELRNNKTLRQWIYYSTLDCKHDDQLSSA
jgi:hypothetical protein